MFFSLKIIKKKLKKYYNNINNIEDNLYIIEMILILLNKIEFFLISDWNLNLEIEKDYKKEYYESLQSFFEKYS